MDKNENTKTKKDYRKIQFFKFILAILHFLLVALPVVFIFCVFTMAALTKLIFVLFYVFVIPITTWILGKMFKKAKISVISFVSQIICFNIYFTVVILVIIFKPINLNNEILNYFSAIAVALVLYYIYGNPNLVKKVDNIKTLPNAFLYTQRKLGKQFDYSYLRTFIFISYLGILIFGHLRDIGVHNSQLFLYEQYAIIIIIAIDRLIAGFKVDRKKREIVKSLEPQSNISSDMFEKKLDEIRQDLSRLIELEPNLEIDKIDFWNSVKIWDNFNTIEDPDHPRTKLIQHILFLCVISGGNSNEKINKLFSLLGKEVKEQMKKSE